MRSADEQLECVKFSLLLFDLSLLTVDPKLLRFVTRLLLLDLRLLLFEGVDEDRG